MSSLKFIVKRRIEIYFKVDYLYVSFSTLLELLKRREKSKKELLQLTIEILEKRYVTSFFLLLSFFFPDYIKPVYLF